MRIQWRRKLEHWHYLRSNQIKFFASDQISDKTIIHKIQQSESLRNEQSDDDLFRFTISRLFETANLCMLERREQHWNSWKLGTSSQRRRSTNLKKINSLNLSIHRWSCVDRTESAGKKLCATWQFGWVWWTSEINLPRENRAWSWTLSLILAASTFIPYSHNPFLILPGAPTDTIELNWTNQPNPAKNRQPILYFYVSSWLWIIWTLLVVDLRKWLCCSKDNVQLLHPPSPLQHHHKQWVQNSRNCGTTNRNHRERELTLKHWVPNHHLLFLRWANRQ
jgi:hypothetical protein